MTSTNIYCCKVTRRKPISSWTWKCHPWKCRSLKICSAKVSRRRQMVGCRKRRKPVVRNWWVCEENEECFQDGDFVGILNEMFAFTFFFRQECNVSLDLLRASCWAVFASAFPRSTYQFWFWKLASLRLFSLWAVYFLY